MCTHFEYCEHFTCLVVSTRFSWVSLPMFHSALQLSSPFPVGDGPTMAVRHILFLVNIHTIHTKHTYIHAYQTYHTYQTYIYVFVKILISQKHSASADISLVDIIFWKVVWLLNLAKHLTFVTNFQQLNYENTFPNKLLLFWYLAVVGNRSVCHVYLESLHGLLLADVLSGTRGRLTLHWCIRGRLYIWERGLMELTWCNSQRGAARFRPWEKMSMRVIYYEKLDCLQLKDNMKSKLESVSVNVCASCDHAIRLPTLILTAVMQNLFISLIRKNTFKKKYIYIHLCLARMQ